MISELYAIDDLLVDSYDTIVTIVIQSKTSENVWGDPIPLDPSNIISESLEIKQSICDETELKIGGCIPSQLSLSVIEVNENLSGKRIIVTVRGRYYSGGMNLFPSTSLFPSSELFPSNNQSGIATTDEYILFIGQIYSCVKTNNFKIKKIVAFDRMYYASTALCKNQIYNKLRVTDTRYFSDWFSWLLPKARINLPSASLLINYRSELSMIEDIWDKVVDKKCTYLSFLLWLCELNGVFLIEDSATSINGTKATPRIIKPYLDVKSNMTIDYFEISSYSSLKYDDFLTKEIRYAQFDSENTYVYLHEDPYEGYSYYLSDNPLTKCIRQSDKVLAIVSNLSAAGSDNKDKITGKVYEYRPFKASIFNRWWVQVGDRIKLPTSDPDVPFVESLVLSRTIKGMYGLTVEIEAKGVEIMGKENDENK